MITAVQAVLSDVYIAHVDIAMMMHFEYIVLP